MKINLIHRLIKLMEEKNLQELELKGPFSAIRLVRGVETHIPSAPPAAEIEKPVVKEKEISKNLVPIKAPMVGTFYRSLNPGTPSFVEIGDTVTPGKVVCIIEAMKVMNEIEAEISGKVVDILAKNEESVEHGQELFLIEPRA